ncbi:MAG: LamG domain protein jellyroll fold domain protein, partial [Candidatus Giovannonibacteria bacterium GW2011_GWC2_44_9]
GKIGQALEFDGSNDLVNAQSGASLDDLGPVTISAWIKPDSSGNNGMIVGKYNAGGDGDGFMAILIDNTAPEINTFKFFKDAPGADLRRITSNNSVSYGVWQHIIATWDGSTNAANVHIYKDGSELSYQATESVASLNSDQALNLIIGNGAGNINDFDGLIDDVRIYNRALSAADITELSDSAPPARSSGSPSGVLPSGTTQATLSLTTDENATCKYSTTAGTPYSSMPNTFSATGGVSHSTTVTGLTDGNTYTYYIRCQDAVGNVNADDFIIAFSIASSAPSSYNLSGWAWSGTVGWQSFNSTNQGGSVDYGVNADSGGIMSGYAWSDQVGWISFNETSGCQTDPDCQAQLSLATGEVSGWARARTPVGHPQAGGWDGWIHLRGTAVWDGWAWGADVVGWVHFKGLSYGVLGSGTACVNPTPICGNGVAEGDEQCDGSDLRGATCASLGFKGGPLSCTTPPATTCLYDTTACTAYQCSDGFDNDSDTFIDFPNDPGCYSSTDDDERNSSVQCDDGLDNDGDLFIDYPTDVGCSSPADNDERNQCSDGIDNDFDEKIDYSSINPVNPDPGCSSSEDNDERDLKYREVFTPFIYSVASALRFEGGFSTIQEWITNYLFHHQLF